MTGDDQPQDPTRVLIEYPAASHIDNGTRPLPLLSVVIVSWNTADLLDQCLRSIAKEVGDTTHEVIVVDNGSDDGSADLVRRLWPNTILIVNESNQGYQRANNRGMAAARGERLLLLNADACLLPGSLTILMSNLDRDNTIGVVAPRLVYPDGSWQRWTAGREPSLVGAFAFFLFLERISRRFADCSLWLYSDTAEAFSPDWVSSACLMLRRDTLADTGPMNERFFAYMDDVDLCRLARSAGWTVRYDPAATVMHVMGAGTRRRTGAASPLALRTFNQYFASLHSAPQTALLKAVEAIGFAARVVAHVALLVADPIHHRKAIRTQWRNTVIALERMKTLPAAPTHTTPTHTTPRHTPQPKGAP